MKKLRINRTLYTNQGTSDPAKRGKIEHHITFKFDTEREAITFKDNVKNWYYGQETDSELEERTKSEPKKRGRPKKNIQGP